MSQTLDTKTTNTKWQSYPEYKHSGIEWLGEIPSHWEIWKTTHAFGDIGSGTTPLSSNAEYYDGDIPWVNTSELRDGNITQVSKKVTSKALVDFPTLRVYPAGTLLIALYGATIGKVGILQLSATTNQACCALSNAKQLDIKFTFYWLFASRQQLILLASGGGQLNISQDTIRSLRIPAPPLPEQRAIAAFLDRETAHISALIAKKQRLIDLLREKRTALISHAVTKGLDPTAPMKDSGVAWLGEIPSHWFLKKLQYACLINPRKSEVSQLAVDTKVSFLPMELIGEDGTLTSKEVRTIEQVWQGFTYFQDNDVLLAKITPCFENGKGGLCKNLVNGIGFGTTELHVLRPNKETSPKFIFYLTKTSFFRKEGIATMHGSAGQQRVSEEFIRNFSIGFPPLTEQCAIAAYLDRETAKIDALISTIEGGIKKLQEYSTALVSAAVTGKIDVRKGNA